MTKPRFLDSPDDRDGSLPPSVRKEADDLLREVLGDQGMASMPSSDPGIPAAAAAAVAPAPNEAGPDQPGRERIAVAGQVVEIAEMAVYDWASAPHEPLELAARLMSSLEPGHWAARLEWPALGGCEATVYRVLFGDGQAPETDCDDPEITLTVCTGTEAIDDTSLNRPLAGARYYEVWVYRGPDVASAVHRPPYLYATGHVVWPPLGIRAKADDGQIVGSWEAVPDARYRWSKQAPREARQHRPSPQAGLEVREPGFVDRDVTPGVPYVYSVFVGLAGPHGWEWCDEPARVKSDIPVKLQPVMDLIVERDADVPGLVHLSWANPPAGEVRIYRSRRAPAADVHHAGEISLDELDAPEYGIEQVDLLPNFVTRSDDGRRASMRNVALPADQAEFYFTPVTKAIRGKQCVPGKSVTLLRPMPPGRPYLEDRVDWMLIVFEWPPGASLVSLFVTPPGQSLDPASARPLATITEDEAKSFGGFQIARDQLAVGRTSLHLASFKQHGGAQAYSSVVTLEHEFPVMANYSLLWQKAAFRGWKLQLTLASREGLASAGLALAWLPEGLPLDCQHAQVLASWRQPIPSTANPAPPVDVKSLLRGRPLPKSGYLRLLANPAENLALLDPPAAQLRIPMEGK